MKIEVHKHSGFQVRSCESCRYEGRKSVVNLPSSENKNNKRFFIGNCFCRHDISQFHFNQLVTRNCSLSPYSAAVPLCCFSHEHALALNVSTLLFHHTVEYLRFYSCIKPNVLRIQYTATINFNWIGKRNMCFCMVFVHFAISKANIQGVSKYVP